MAKPTKLINDLSSVPSIVGNLGLSIAEAQKAFNLDYLNGIERLIAAAKSILPPAGAADPNADQHRAFILDLLKATAPSRYQFTETTLAVRLDLSQSMDASASGGFGAGFGAVAVNASFAIGYGYDYQAAAECRTIIHAIPADPASLNTFLAQADKASANALKLPARHSIDQRILTQLQKVSEKLTGTAPAPIVDE